MYGRSAPEWELVGGDPAPGEPAAYCTLSELFHGTAQNASEAACRLRALALNADDSVWRGEAADAFREDLGQLPKKLDQLYHSYHEASEALRLYGVSLGQLQARAESELQKALAADEEMRRQVDALLDRMTGLPSTAPPPVGAGPGPTMVGPVAPAGGSGHDPTEDARARLAAARGAVEQIRQERETEEGKVVAKLERASEIGIQNRGLLDRIGGWAGERIDRLNDLAHRTLRAMGDVADRLSEIMTVVAVVLALGAAIAAMALTGGMGAPAIVGLLWSASTTIFTAATVSTALSVAAKATSKSLYDDADLSWGTLAVDGALAAVGIAGGTSTALKGGARYLDKGKKVLKSTKAFQAVSARMAQSGPGLSALSLPAGVQTFSAHAGRIGDEVLAKAKPLMAKIEAFKVAKLGTKAAPTELGMIHKGVRGIVPLDLGTAVKITLDPSRAVDEIAPLVSKYGDDPLKILDPVDFGPPTYSTWVRVPLVGR